MDPVSTSSEVAQIPGMDPVSSSSDAAPILDTSFLSFPYTTTLHWNLSVRFFTFFTFPTQ
jgi:hypothetical protein